MDDDLNTSKALAVLFELVNKANKDEKDAYAKLVTLGQVLGFNFAKIELTEDQLKEKINTINNILNTNASSMEEIIEMRNNARKEKNWEISDKIRNALDANGIVLKDSKDGTSWELKN